MIVADVMSPNVVSIAPEATVEAAIKLMLAHGISGLFVVDQAGELAGVITEGDLLRRDELGTERGRPWWLRMLVSPGRQAADFTRAHGRYVRDVMTADVISVADDAALETVVAAMEHNRIKRLPVTRDGGVIGVISRSDLLRALVEREQHDDTPVVSDDNTIHTAIQEALQSAAWAPVTTLHVTVVEGVVDLQGTITNEEERKAIRVVAENVPGVKRVDDHLVYVEPYTGTVIDPSGDAT